MVSEISDSSISMNKTPIKESILNFSQSAHARVDRNGGITDFTYLTHLLRVETLLDLGCWTHH